MSTFVPGQEVLLVPSNSGYQKERKAKVVRLTATQVVVQPSDARAEIRFHLADGSPVAKRDQGFPRYILKAQNKTTD